METINHECYVDLEVAKLLKEAEFDWECSSYYDDDIFHKGNDELPRWEGDYIYSAPTLEVAQRWLREMKEIDVIVTYEAVLNKKTVVYEKKYAVVVYDAFIKKDNNYHDTYEEALEAGIQKCLTILLEEKK